MQSKADKWLPFRLGNDSWYPTKHRMKHPHWPDFHFRWKMFFTWEQTLTFSEMFYWLTQLMGAMQYQKKQVSALFLNGSFETTCQLTRASFFIADSKHLKTDESTRSTVSLFHLFLTVFGTPRFWHIAGIKHILALTCTFQKSRLKDAQQIWPFAFSKCLLVEQSVLE